MEDRDPTLRRTPSQKRLPNTEGASPFKFGYNYTHFFYALGVEPPHQLLATSAEFCLGSPQDGADCESVQASTSTVPA